MKISAITSTIAIFFSLLILAVLVTLIVLVIRALLKYLKSKEVRDEKGRFMKMEGLFLPG